MIAYETASKDPVLRQLLNEAVEAVCAKEGSILLLSKEGRVLRFVVSTSGSEKKLQGLEQPITKGITALSVSLQQPMIVNQTAKSPAFDPSVDAQTGVKTESIMVIPITTPKEELGALTAVNSTVATGFSGHDLERYSEFAEQIASRLSGLGFGKKDAGTIK